MTLLICEIQKTKQVNKPSKIETDSQMHRTNTWGRYNQLVGVRPVMSVCALKGRTRQAEYKIRPEYMLSTRDALQIETHEQTETKGR